MVSYFGKIINREIKCKDKTKFEEEYSTFLQENEKKFVRVTYTIIDSIKYSQHVYYRSCLLPALAKYYMDSENKYTTDEIHLLLKKEFMYIPIEDYTDVPKKFRNSSMIEYIETEVESIDEKGISKKTKKIKWKGYYKSMSVYTQEEAKTFIKKCEERLLFIGGGISDLEAIYHRKVIFNEKK